MEASKAKKDHSNTPTVGLIDGYAAKEMKRRILELKSEKKKKKNWVLSILAAFVLVAVQWVTALAYDPAPKIAATPGSEPNPDAEIVLGGFPDLYELYGSNFGDTFVDDDGNTYTISSEAQRASCGHKYVSTTAAEHVRHPNGSCTVISYRIQRCTICGDIKSKVYDNEITFKKCPH